MRSFRGIVAWALCVHLIAGTPALAVDTQTLPAAAAANSGWMPRPCTETATIPSRPLPPRPAVRRRTFASPLPHRALRHQVHKKRAAHAAPRKRRTAPHHVHHPARRHSTAAARPRTALRNTRPALRRVTFASPICEDRAPAINALLGLPDVPMLDQPLVASALQDVLAPEDQPLLGVPVAGYGDNGAGGDAPGGVLPSSPGYPTGGGPGGGVPVVVVPTGPGGGVTPGNPVISVPPPVTSSVPEPTTWAIMVMGFGLIGGAMRRRRTPRQVA